MASENVHAYKLKEGDTILWFDDTEVTLVADVLRSGAFTFSVMVTSEGEPKPFKITLGEAQKVQRRIV